MARKKAPARKTSKKKRAAKKAPRKKTKKRPVGRPSKYTQKLADRLCESLSEGMSMHRACEPDDMPTKRTVFSWLRTNEKFLHQYENAKAEAADYLAEELIEIADNGTNDYLIQLADEISEKPASEWTEDDIKVLAIKHLPEQVQRSRLRVDARKWTASKLKPKKYGDKMALTDPDGGPLSIAIVDPTRAEN